MYGIVTSTGMPRRGKGGEHVHRNPEGSSESRSQREGRERQFHWQSPAPLAIAVSRIPYASRITW
jgi:hypothetical protein